MQHNERRDTTASARASEAGGGAGSIEATDIEEVRHPVRIGGRDYSLVFNMLSIEAFYKVTGTSLFLKETLDQLGPEDNPAYFSAALWAGLQTYHPELTLDFVRTRLRFREARSAVKSVIDAIVDDFPESRPPEPEKAPAMKSSTPAVLETNSSASGTQPASSSD